LVEAVNIIISYCSDKEHKNSFTPGLIINDPPVGVYDYDINIRKNNVLEFHLNQAPRLVLNYLLIQVKMELLFGL